MNNFIKRYIKPILKGEAIYSSPYGKFRRTEFVIFVLIIGALGSYLIINSFAHSNPCSNYPSGCIDYRVGGTYNVHSTYYRTGTITASGKTPYVSSVALPQPITPGHVPFGAQFRINSGPWAGRTVTVEDRIGHGSDFDLWDPSGEYGARTISITYLGTGGSTSLPPSTPSPPPSSSVNPDSCNDPHPTLRSGSSDRNCVAHLQRYLEKHGYSLSPFGVDGDFGSLTKRKLQDFQKNMCISADGVAGPQTWSKLHSPESECGGGSGDNPSGSPPAGNAIAEPSVSTSCTNNTSIVNISWNNPGILGVKEYIVDIDDDNFRGGWWNKKVGLATSTSAPGGFNFYPSPGHSLTLESGQKYYVRVFYNGPNVHSQTREFTITNDCSVSINDVANGVDRLDQNQQLLRGNFLKSQNGKYLLSLQSSDGHLVLYNNQTGRPIWANQIWHGESFIMQSDGNAVVYNASNKPIWASNTFGTGKTLIVQNDGNMVIYNSSDRPVWSSNTFGR